MHGHVLHDAQHWNVDLFEHLQRLARIQRGDLLRRGHDHRPGHRDLLGQGQLDIAGARWQVHQQVVQVVPAGVVEQLGQGRGGHRPAPDHRRVHVHQQADRHGLHAERTQRLDRLVVRTLRAPGQAQHGRHAGPVHVRVQHPDLRPQPLQGQGQVDRGGGLAHPALAGTDGDDVADPRRGGQGGLDGVGGDARARLETRQGQALGGSGGLHPGAQARGGFRTQRPAGQQPDPAGGAGHLHLPARLGRGDGWPRRRCRKAFEGVDQTGGGVHGGLSSGPVPGNCDDRMHGG